MPCQWFQIYNRRLFGYRTPVAEQPSIVDLSSVVTGEGELKIKQLKKCVRMEKNLKKCDYTCTVIYYYVGPNQ